MERVDRLDDILRSKSTGEYQAADISPRLPECRRDLRPGLWNSGAAQLSRYPGIEEHRVGRREQCRESRRQRRALGAHHAPHFAAEMTANVGNPLHVALRVELHDIEPDPVGDLTDFVGPLRSEDPDAVDRARRGAKDGLRLIDRNLSRTASENDTHI